MEPNQQEIESRKVANLLVYVLKSIRRIPSQEIVEIARDVYGAPDMVHKLTEQLCTLCGDMSKAEAARVIYDGKNAEARKLADWWEAHQEADKAREEQEAEDKARANVKKRALAKLTAAERAALGI